MKLIFCLIAVVTASPFLDEYLEARAESNTLGQPMGAMAGPAATNGGPPSPQRGRPTLSSLLEKLDTLLGGAIAARDLGDMDELEELIARAKIGIVAARDIDNLENDELLAREFKETFHPVNHYPVRKPGRLPEGMRPKFRIGESVKPGPLMNRDMLDDELWY